MPRPFRPFLLYSTCCVRYVRITLQEMQESTPAPMTQHMRCCDAHVEHLSEDGALLPMDLVGCIDWLYVLYCTHRGFVDCAAGAVTIW